MTSNNSFMTTWLIQFIQFRQIWKSTSQFLVSISSYVPLKQTTKLWAKLFYDWIRKSQSTIINSKKTSLKNKHTDNFQWSMVLPWSWKSAMMSNRGFNLPKHANLIKRDKSTLPVLNYVNTSKSLTLTLTIILRSCSPGSALLFSFSYNLH